METSAGEKKVEEEAAMGEEKGRKVLEMFLEEKKHLLIQKNLSLVRLLLCVI